MLDTRTYSTGINLQIQSALLAALEILVEGNMLLRNHSTVMFEILFPIFSGVCYFSLACYYQSPLLFECQDVVWSRCETEPAD